MSTSNALLSVPSSFSVLRTHHLDIGHTHTPSSSRLIKCLVDIFSCIHLERRKAASGKGKNGGILLEDRHAQEPESEAAMGVGVLKSFPASRRVRTLKVRTELTSLQSQLHCCWWLPAQQFMLRTIYARMLLVRFSEPTPLEKDRTELSAFPCLLSSVRKMQQHGRF